MLTWITARTTHAYSLGVLLGVPGSAAVADAALKALTGRLRDAEHGGWFHALAPDGTPDRAAGKSCYNHAFVLLAASSAALAGRPGGATLLAEAADVYLTWFWDDDAGRPVDTWDADFTRADDYRGLNATMHSVEALLAVADAVEVLDASDAPGVGGERLPGGTGPRGRRDSSSSSPPHTTDACRNTSGRTGPRFSASTATSLTTPSSRTAPHPDTAWSGRGCC